MLRGSNPLIAAMGGIGGPRNERRFEECRKGYFRNAFFRKNEIHFRKPQNFTTREQPQHFIVTIAYHEIMAWTSISGNPSRLLLQGRESIR